MHSSSSRHFSKRNYLLLFSLFLSLPPVSSQAQNIDVSAEEVASAYTYLNELRSRADMLNFTRNATLEEAAQNHSTYLAINLRSGHDEIAGEQGFTGSTGSIRAGFVGYSANVGENVSSGQSSIEASIDDLMGAIYHRFGFFSFSHDEIGIGVAASNNLGFYTYNTGNKGLNALCDAGGDFSGAGTFRFGVCASDPDIRINASTYAMTEAEIAGMNPEIVVWPVQGESDFPPAFYEESPDPLPDLSVSGNPVSIQFNPLTNTSSSVSNFRLFNLETGAEVTNTRLINQLNDVNAKFSALDHALFPLERLDWNTAYRVQASYTSDAGSGTLQWAFRTRDPGFPIFNYAGNGNTITVPSNHLDFVLYIPPESGFTRISGFGFSFPAGAAADTSFLDGNTLAINLSGSIGDQFVFNLNDGRSFTLVISSPENLSPKPETSLEPGSTPVDEEDPVDSQADSPQATYNLSTGVLSLPFVQVDNGLEVGADLTLVGTKPFRFKLQQTKSVDRNATATTFNQGTNILAIPLVRVGNIDYRVSMRLISNDYTFELIDLTQL